MERLLNWNRYKDKTWFTGVMTDVVIWWIVLLAVLPWGVRSSSNHQLGHDKGAPEKPFLLLKMSVTTLISAIFWVIVFLFFG